MKILVLDEHWKDYQGLLVLPGQQLDFGDDPGAFGGGYDVLLAQPGLAAQYLRRGHQVPWVQSTWAGVDDLVPAARGTDLTVTGIKGIFGPQIAEYVFAYLLSQARSVEFFHQQQTLANWSPRFPETLSGESIVILGTGSIGRHLASVAKGFGMVTLGVSLSGAPHKEFDEVQPVEKLPELAGRAKTLVVVLPDTPLTAGVVNDTVFAELPDQATLINVGRGASLCESSLRRWLDSPRAGRAVLDVFTREPLAQDHWLWRNPRTVITPHVAAVSFPRDIAGIFLGNLERYQRGEPLEHVVDVDRGY